MTQLPSAKAAGLHLFASRAKPQFLFQSNRKSYLLNHLCGSTFDGSAQRCTEGVWMSLVPTAKTLYVVMDFEGLRSLERTPQGSLIFGIVLKILRRKPCTNLIMLKNNRNSRGLVPDTLQRRGFEPHPIQK
ncbi:hypothetical protein BC936DRAFT_148610 [Jimgerdemannia flammicorona]|uniref:Uncharacterized protein n=1 Tax=Jimgerdemannia flammicorona TaxID=994334 RepID=A0A433D2M1_9FUNG|nr:hypothetical protein BC936DRAFT_148610 [Jimgerdemannia flammicorona]